MTEVAPTIDVTGSAAADPARLGGDRARIAWLHRRAGFGLGPGELDALEALGVDAVLDRLIEGDVHGVPANPDPWAAFPADPAPGSGQARRDAVAMWLLHLAATPRPLEEWMRWFWHGHLVSSLADVAVAEMMVNQLRTYGDLGLGPLRELLVAATVDPAMLLYLDGDDSVAGAPNENYSRELLELFALGLGQFTEADVRAGAIALTGWRVRSGETTQTFVERAHDDTPQRFLGVDGVHDLDTVIDAVTDHEACAPWVARCLADAVLGAGSDDALIEDLGDGFRADGLSLRPLVRRVLEAGLDGASRPMILPPVPWLAAVMRATGAVPGRRQLRELVAALQSMGQVPLYPPNVSGWPGDEAWLSSSATVGRLAAAVVVAEATPEDAPVLLAAASGDDAALADGLARPDGFGAATIAAVGQARSLGGPPGVAPLAVALASPELVEA